MTAGARPRKRAFRFAAPAFQAAARILHDDYHLKAGYPRGMKVNRQVQSEHRAAMVEQAGALFRARGIAAVGVAEITGAAGLTHGAVYGHFAGKAALVAEACRSALEQSATRWRRRAAATAASGDDPLAALIDSYLTETHRDRPQTGCALAALGPEVARDLALRGAMGEGAEALLAALRDIIAERLPDADAETTALGVLAALNGGLMLARALADRPERSHAALDAARLAARRVAGIS